MKIELFKRIAGRGGNIFANLNRYGPICLIFLAVCQLFVPPCGLCDPGIRDSVIIDSIAILEGEQAKLPVYFFNDEALVAVQLTLRFDTLHLIFDSFSRAGSRLEYIPDGSIFFRDSADLLDIIFQDWQEWIPRGSGLMCHLYFSSSPTAGGNLCVIDSAFYPPFSETMFSDSVANTILPDFKAGHIFIGDIPFICGDVSGNGAVNALDVTFLINYLYKGGAAPYPTISADVNGSGTINALDITYLINFLYKGGSALKCPS
jgi:hypothetical protein